MSSGPNCLCSGCGDLQSFRPETTMSERAGGTAVLLGTLSPVVKRLTLGVAKMLSLVVTLLIIALIAGVLGFGGIAGAAVGIAKIVFFIALVLFLVSLLAGGMRGGFGRGL
jgi:uncharacterized membrane protein YtjA (UPF0391 family)